MGHAGSIEYTGIVVEALPGTLFRIQLPDGSMVICTLAGKMRINYVKILPGDRVTIEVSEYDKSRGRITRRL